MFICRWYVFNLFCNRLTDVLPIYITAKLSSNREGADHAERDKHNHYIDLKNHFNFNPLAFESMGCVNPVTELFLSKFGKLMKRKTGEPRSFDFLLQRISIAIQRGNAVSNSNTYCDRSDFNAFMWYFYFPSLCKCIISMYTSNVKFM